MKKKKRIIELTAGVSIITGLPDVTASIDVIEAGRKIKEKYKEMSKDKKSIEKPPKERKRVDEKEVVSMLVSQIENEKEQKKKTWANRKQPHEVSKLGNLSHSRDVKLKAWSNKVDKISEQKVSSPKKKHKELENEEGLEY